MDLSLRLRKRCERANWGARARAIDTSVALRVRSSKGIMLLYG